MAEKNFLSDKDAADLQELVREMSKLKPDTMKVKPLIKKFQIPFSADPIEQMTLLLQHFDTLHIHFGKDSEL